MPRDHLRDPPAPRELGWLRRRAAWTFGVSAVACAFVAVMVPWPFGAYAMLCGVLAAFLTIPDIP